MNQKLITKFQIFFFKISLQKDILLFVWIKFAPILLLKRLKGLNWKKYGSFLFLLPEFRWWRHLWESGWSSQMQAVFTGADIPSLTQHSWLKHLSLSFHFNKPTSCFSSLSVSLESNAFLSLMFTIMSSPKYWNTSPFCFFVRRIKFYLNTLLFISKLTLKIRDNKVVVIL